MRSPHHKYGLLFDAVHHAAMMTPSVIKEREQELQGGFGRFSVKRRAEKKNRKGSVFLLKKKEEGSRVFLPQEKRGEEILTLLAGFLKKNIKERGNKEAEEKKQKWGWVFS